MGKTRKKQVVVIGSSDNIKYSEPAELIGRHIANMGHVLVCGGRGGLMEAASRGASNEGGLVLGILPGETDEEANPWCDIVIPTGIGYARNSINVLAGDVVVSLHGKAGTLSELAYAWLYNKPIICCTFTGGWSKRMFPGPIDDRNGTIYFVSSVEEACSTLDMLLPAGQVE